MSLAMDFNGVFKCGMSVAPVTDWALYGTSYLKFSFIYIFLFKPLSFIFSIFSHNYFFSRNISFQRKFQIKNRDGLITNSTCTQKREKRNRVKEIEGINDHALMNINYQLSTEQPCKFYERYTYHDTSPPFVITKHINLFYRIS